MRGIFLILVLALGVFVQLPLSVARAAQTEGIAVVVNDDAITTSDVKARMKLILTSSGLPATSDVVEKLEPQIINNLIDERLMLQEAAKLEINPTPADIENGFKTIAQQNNMDADKFRAILAREGINLKTLEEQIRAQISWSGVIQAKLRPQVTITDNEVDATLERLRASVGKSRYLVSEIFLPIEAAKDEAAARQLADKLVNELQQGKVPFQRVASQFSQSAGAARGGDLGWVEEGQLPSELEAVLAQMQEGELSKPVRSLTGLHILHLRKKSAIAAENIPPRENIYESLGMERLDRLQRRYLLDLKSAAFIERRV